jgi:hypothetical protein
MAQRSRQRRRLGGYLIGVAVAQAVLYAIAATSGNRLLWLSYLDPRIGLFVLETFLRHHETFPGVLSWTSAAVLGAVGVALVRDPGRLRLYVIVEALLGFPTLLMFVAVLAANSRPAHGLSVAELIVPLPIFLAASVVPFAVAFRTLRRRTTPA